jgi:hypothetical protein
MSLDRAAHDTVHFAKEGTKAIAAKMGLSPQMLLNKVGLNNETHHLRMSEAALLMRVTGDTRILETLANELGGIFIHVPDLASGAPSSLVGDLANMSAEFGALMKEVADGVADGQLSDNEMSKVEREAEKLRAALAFLLRDLRILNQSSALPAK